MKKFEVIRNASIGDLLETFLVSSVVSILIIRFFLEITGYPQLGGGSFHIAHMLWGGMLMSVSIVMMLSFLGIHVRHIAAVVGGIGFGTFLDELGKFITSDNNYYYQPTTAILYIIFLILFFTFRRIERKEELTEKEYLMNSLELLGEAVRNDMDSEERHRLLNFLEKANGSSHHNHFTKHIVALLHEIRHVKHPKSNPVDVMIKKLIERFNAFIRSSLMQRLIIAFFISNVVLALITVLFILYSTAVSRPYTFNLPASQHVFFATGELIATIMSIILSMAGVSILRFSRYRAYYLFKYSILVSILVTQFFVFYREQFSAIFGLLFNAVVLASLNYMISLEQAKRKPVPESVKI